MKASSILAKLVLVILSLGSGLSVFAEEAQPGAKFDVYLLAGQSNMAGRGKLTDMNRLDTTRVFKWNSWQVKGVGDAWIPATEPIVSDRSFSGACLGASFARTLVDEDSTLSIGLVPAAEGGSPLERWMPGKDLYVRAITQTRAALKKGGKLKAILWHQGCADGNKNSAETYAVRLAEMVAAMRKDLDAPNVPFIAGELGDYLDAFKGKDSAGKEFLYIPYWKLINAQINEASKVIPNMYVVKTAGLTDKGDHLHFSTESLRTLGLKYAAMLKEAIQK